MISKIVLTITSLVFALIAFSISRNIIKKQKIIGKPPIPAFYFMLAKLMVAVNLTFLMMKGLRINVCGIYSPVEYSDIIALVFLVVGSIILILSTIRLDKDLVFGLSSSEYHKLQTRGIYSLSRHPFYLGFLFILFSSCLFNPHLLNIIAFALTWIIHHFIMIKEEEFLLSRYGEAYNDYRKRVKRYFTF